MKPQKQRQLFDFAAEGKLKHLKRLLDEQVDVNITDYDKRCVQFIEIVKWRIVY